MKTRIVLFLESLAELLGSRVWYCGWLILLLPLALLSKVRGRENIPMHHTATRGLIIVANHLSYMDVPVIGTLFPPSRPISFLGKKELFDVPILGTICKNGHMIAVERNKEHSTVNIRAVKQALTLLKNGGALGIFMQGGIGWSDIKRSPIVLAERTNAVILPIGLTQNVWFHTNAWKGVDIGPYQVTIGKPLTVSNLGDGNPETRAERLWYVICELSRM